MGEALRAGPERRPTSGRLEVDEQEMLSYQCQSRTGGAAMDLRLELVSVPVADVDRAKAFYVDRVGLASSKMCGSTRITALWS